MRARANAKRVAQDAVILVGYGIGGKGLGEAIFKPLSIVACTRGLTGSL